MTTTLDPPIILIVDDDFINRFVLGKTLEILEQTYHECENGEDAINWLKATTHNHIVVLLDLNMPIMDGYDFLEYLKEYPSEFEHTNIKVVVISASPYSQFLEKLPHAEIVQFLSKPIDKDHIKNAIEESIESFHQ